MLTHKQQSFIADVSSPGADLNFLGVLLGQPVKIMLPGTGGGVFSGRFNYRDDSHLLSHQASTQSPPVLTLYFSHTDEGYLLYVRSSGPQFDKAISSCPSGAIGAFHPEQVAPTHFEIVGPKGPVTLSDIAASQFTCLLRDHKSGNCVHRSRRHDSSHIYLFSNRNEQLPFRVNILERNI